jgi:hypothetical protein
MIRSLLSLTGRVAVGIDLTYETRAHAAQRLSALASVRHRTLASDGVRLPGAMFDTVPASCRSDKIRAVASGSANVLPVTQPRPATRSV